MSRRLLLPLALWTWLTIGTYNAGAYYAHLQLKYYSIADKSRASDSLISILIAGAGPVAIPGILSINGYSEGWLLPFTRRNK